MLYVMILSVGTVCILIVTNARMINYGSNISVVGVGFGVDPTYLVVSVNTSISRSNQYIVTRNLFPFADRHSQSS